MPLTQVFVSTSDLRSVHHTRHNLAELLTVEARRLRLLTSFSKVWRSTHPARLAISTSLRLATSSSRLSVGWERRWPSPAPWNRG